MLSPASQMTREKHAAWCTKNNREVEQQFHHQQIAEGEVIKEYVPRDHCGESS